jgi:hypothetical protein
VGKTFIVREAFATLGFTNKYMPLPRNFFMGTSDPSTHDHIMFEEWEFEVFKFNYPQIKQLLDRQCFQVDIKNRSGRNLKVQCPVVFISNSTPYDDRAFVRRVQVIEAIESLENAVKITVPKEEVDGLEMEVTDIASDSDTENASAESQSRCCQV